MTEQYSQTVEVAVTSKTKAKQWIGIAAVLFSLGFLMATIFVVWYFVFCFLVIFAIGVIYMHFYNVTAKEFTYELSPSRLVIVKKDLMGRQSRILLLLLEDIVQIGLMDALADEDDVVACNAVNERGVYQIVYSENEKNRRLLFAPDDYMLALLKNRIENKFVEEQSGTDLL